MFTALAQSRQYLVAAHSSKSSTETIPLTMFANNASSAQSKVVPEGITASQRQRLHEVNVAALRCDFNEIIEDARTQLRHLYPHEEILTRHIIHLWEFPEGLSFHTRCHRNTGMPGKFLDWPPHDVDFWKTNLKTYVTQKKIRLTLRLSDSFNTSRTLNRHREASFDSFNDGPSNNASRTTRSGNNNLEDTIHLVEDPQELRHRRSGPSRVTLSYLDLRRKAEQIVEDFILRTTGLTVLTTGDFGMEFSGKSSHHMPGWEWEFNHGYSFPLDHSPNLKKAKITSWSTFELEEFLAALDNGRLRLVSSRRMPSHVHAEAARPSNELSARDSDDANQPDIELSHGYRRTGYLVDSLQEKDAQIKEQSTQIRTLNEEDERLRSENARLRTNLVELQKKQQPSIPRNHANLVELFQSGFPGLSPKSIELFEGILPHELSWDLLLGMKKLSDKVTLECGIQFLKEQIDKRLHNGQSSPSDTTAVTMEDINSVLEALDIRPENLPGPDSASSRSQNFSTFLSRFCEARQEDLPAVELFNSTFANSYFKYSVEDMRLNAVRTIPSSTRRIVPWANVIVIDPKLHKKAPSLPGKNGALTSIDAKGYGVEKGQSYPVIVQVGEDGFQYFGHYQVHETDENFAEMAHWDDLDADNCCEIVSQLTHFHWRAMLLQQGRQHKYERIQGDATNESFGRCWPAKRPHANAPAIEFSELFQDGDLKLKYQFLVFDSFHFAEYEKLLEERFSQAKGPAHATVSEDIEQRPHKRPRIDDYIFISD